MTLCNGHGRKTCGCRGSGRFGSPTSTHGSRRKPMRRVLQTRTGAPHGNCTAACYASIVEVPLSEVPDPRWPDDVPWQEGQDETLTKRGLQYQVFQDWLGGFGLRSLRITCDGSLFILGYAIGMVINPRSIPHAVVCYNRKVAQPAPGFLRRRGARPRSLHPARPGAREAAVVSSRPFQ